MNKWIAIILVLSCSVSCKEKKQNEDIISAIKETGTLVTAEYTLSKIIKANDNKTWYKIGNRKILMTCEAYVKAGIDLRQVAQKDVLQDDSTLSIQLPKAQIFSLHIPGDKIQVAYQDIDVFRDPYSASEREALMAQAQQQMALLADSLGILKTAEENGALYLKNLLQATTSKKVSVLISK
jgi:hypothetical protein